jgi:peptide/nickel transport system substrate-binding protein
VPESDVKTIRTSLAALAVLTAASVEARDITIGITQYPSTLHPNIDSMLAKSYVHGMTLRPITAYDEEWELRCHLCVTLPSLENGLAVREPQPDEEADGVAVTYEIHPDATWGDGTPVTTADVLFTWEVGRHPQSGVGAADLYRRITEIDVIDDKSFIMHKSKLDFTYNAINDFRLLPAHLERQVFEEDAQTYRNRTHYDTDPTNPGLWFGPYRVSDLVQGSHIVLARNEYWYGDKPAFDRVIVRAIENTAALEANLLSGEIDMIEGALGMALDQALAFEKRHGDSYTVFTKPGLIYEHIDVMLDNPILADVRVRKALLLAADRQALSDQLFEARQPVADTFVNPLDWVHHADVETYAYDPDQARALLDEAGWTEMRGGIRHNADGEPLQMTIMTTSGNRTRELVQQFLQSQWRAVGMDVTIINQPARVLFGETISKRQFEALAMFAWISSPENVPRTTMHSSEIPTEDNNWSGQNYTGFVNERMDALIDAIEIELDRDRRLELWQEIQQIYASELPALPLYFRSNAHIWPKWLGNVVPTGHQSPTTLSIEHWTIDE